METLIKIVKLIDGYELHFKVEGSKEVKKEFVAKPSMKGK